jgi:hypothetical protein
MSLGFLLLCGLQKRDVQENLSPRFITIWAIGISVSPKDTKLAVWPEQRVFSEQKRSDIFAQADLILDRLPRQWLCPFQDGPRSPKQLVGIRVHSRQTTLLEDKM